MGAVMSTDHSAARDAGLGRKRLGGRTRKRKLAAAALRGGAALVLVYAASLVGASVTSRERTLALGEKTYFCEIDCHLAYSVDRVETEEMLGPAQNPVYPSGRFTVVSLRTWFDDSTISPSHPREAPLQPNPRVIYVADAQGRRYEPSPAGQRALEATGRRSTPVTEPLRPGESYLTYLVFDLPPDARAPRLFVGNAPGVEFFLIGHEMAPFHRKVWFALG
jgi:hypothetical protein